MKRLAVVILAVGTMIGTAIPSAARPAFPSSVPLPDGFYPEGIAIGRGHDFYVGSLLDGAIYKGDLRTATGDVFAEGAEGRLVAGLHHDNRSGLLWGVGSEGGEGRVFLFDDGTGELVEEIVVEQGGFLNDLVLTRDTAYVTDSFTPQLWTIPLDSRGGPAGDAAPLPLSGDYAHVTEGPLPINLNGIDATPSGTTLVAVHSTLGVLYRIDPLTGVATEVDLGDADIASADGIVLHGRTLYVVRNFPNELVVVSLTPDLTEGAVVEVIESDLFRVPTTADRFGDRLYLVNARFDEAVPPALGGEPRSIDYDVVAVRT